MERVKESANLAHIADVIESFSDGYQTRVGERGVRLSGGQRQRIGIARALYKKCRILVLDEATSSLDTYTEKQIMSVINQLGRKLTVILIAHRLSTVETCDRLVELEKGKIINIGTPREILE